jgi:hypothetical protein
MNKPKPSYAVEQRLRMIDFLADSYGSVKRRYIQDYFGIGEACATRDFKKYNTIADGNLALNTKTKAYVKTESFERVYP